MGVAMIRLVFSIMGIDEFCVRKFTTIDVLEYIYYSIPYKEILNDEINLQKISNFQPCKGAFNKIQQYINSKFHLK